MKRQRYRTDIRYRVCIYALMFDGVEGIYVGASTRETKRFQEHRILLSNHTHYNHRLQSAWMESNGAMQMKRLDVFEVSYAEEICEREVKWMNDIIAEHSREHLLNLVIDSDITSFRHIPNRSTFAGWVRAL